MGEQPDIIQGTISGKLTTNEIPRLGVCLRRAFGDGYKFLLTDRESGDVLFKREPSK